MFFLSFSLSFKTFLFPCTCWHVKQTSLPSLRHATTLDKSQHKLFAASESLRTEESGQDRVRCGLHLKHTSPEEALVVQSEKWRRSGDGFHWLDLNEKKTSADKKQDGHIWRQLNINVCQLHSTSAPRDPVHQRCHSIQRGSDYRMFFWEVSLWNTHEWYFPFACQKYDWWCWITHCNFHQPLLFKMKDSVVLWCLGGFYLGISFFIYI